MKLILTILSSVLFLHSCTQSGSNQNVKNVEDAYTYSYFGDTISPDGAMNAKDLKTALEGKDSLYTKVSGKIVEACKKKGCWMTIDIGNDEIMRVKFKDYGFFVPKNADGLEMIMEGVAYMNITSVEELKHLAEDANKSKEEIDAITEPELDLSFEAIGVIIKQ
jgi:hypothetical protein